jgi:peptidoglycan/xylan/chitin deacetylase (PgdA/CDA1 family)
MAAVDRWFTVMPLREAAARLRDGTLPVRSACVTFDDGYADNAAVALPVLRRRGVPATFFVSTSFIDGGRMWNDSVIETIRAKHGDVLDARPIGLEPLEISTTASRRVAIDRVLSALKYLPQEERQRCVDTLAAGTTRPLPSDLMMTTEQVRSLDANGMEIGAHTVTNPILARLDAARASDEIRQSKRRLEAITGKPVKLFAYPNGKPGRDYGREHVGMVKELGFEAAVSTAWGVANAQSDAFQLPRFTPWDKSPGKFVLRLLHNTFRTRSELV